MLLYYYYYYFGGFLFGNVTSPLGQVHLCLQACALEASEAPPSRLGARESFGAAWRSLLPSPQLLKHSCSWIWMRARLPGIINVPQAHINHITIKPPNALIEKVTRRKRKEKNLSLLFGLLFALISFYITLQLWSGVSSLRHHMIWVGAVTHRL